MENVVKSDTLKQAEKIVRTWRLRTFLRSCIPQVFYQDLIHDIDEALIIARLRGR